MLFAEADCPATDYAPCNGDNDITEDMYGKPLRERSLEEVIDCLDQIVTLEGDAADYARIRPLLAMLQEYQRIQNDRYRLAVLHYGH